MPFDSRINNIRWSVVSDCIKAFEDCLDKCIEKYLLPHFHSPKELLDEREFSDFLISEKEELSLIKLTNREEINKFKHLNSKINLIQKYLDYLDPIEKKNWSSLQSEFIDLNQVRQAISHRKEITPDHQALTINFCNTASKKSDIFKSLKDVLSDLGSPEAKLGESQSEDEVLVNFPSPDWAVHGFVGRDKLLENVESLLVEHKHPIVSITGEGGIGKTSFVDYACTYLAKNNSFKKIIWFSDKSESFDILTSKVMNISKQQSLKDFANDPLGDGSKTLDELVGMDVLIILDNLDTIFEEGKEFISTHASSKLQFLITSRRSVDLGMPIYMKPLENNESMRLIRNLNSYLAIDDIDNSSNEELENLGAEFQNSPLYIKWGLHQMQKGLQLSSIRKREKEISEFCFSGLIKLLSDQAKQCLDALYVFESSVSSLKLKLVLGIDHEQIIDGLSELQKFSLARSRKKSWKINSSIKPLLKEEKLADLKETLTIKKKIKEMNATISRLKNELDSQEKIYSDQYSYEINSEDDLLIKWAIKEIHREYGLSAQHDEDMALENQNSAFEELLESFPNDPQLLISAGIALHYSKDTSKAIEKFKLAYDLAGSRFIKKKSLYFLSQELDIDNNYYEMQDYANKLHSLEQDFYSITNLLNVYIGIKDFKKALDLYSDSIEMIKNLDRKIQRIKAIQKSFNVMESVLAATAHDLNDETFEKIESLIAEISKAFIHDFDRALLISMRNLLFNYERSYERYLYTLFKSKKINTKLIQKAFMDEISKYPDKKSLYDEVANFSFKDFAGLDYTDRENKNFSDDIVNEAYSNGSSIRGKIIREQISKNILKGYIVEISQSQHFLPKSSAQGFTKVGFTGNFIIHSKGKFNFFVKHSYEDINLLSLTKTKPQKEIYKIGQIKKGRILKIFKDYVNILILDSNNVKGSIRLSDITKERGYEKIRDLRTLAFSTNESIKVKLIGKSEDENYYHMLPAEISSEES